MGKGPSRESEKREMATVAELRVALAEIGVEAGPRLKKAELETLLLEHTIDTDDDNVRTMSRTLSAHKPRYRVEGVGGRLNNGDDLAAFLLALDPFETARLATRVLDLDTPLWVGDGTGKYDHLNNGQIRMNSGNRIRAALKRGDILPEDVFGAAAA